MRTSLVAAAIVAAALSSPGAARAAASYDTCDGFIDAVPVVLTNPGTWCLRKDLTSSLQNGVLIDIQQFSVTVACNGFKISGIGAGPETQAVAIRALALAGAEVRDCNIRGFGHGIWLEGNRHRIRGNRVEETETGIRVTGDVSGQGPMRISDNVVVDSSAFGIQSYGRSVIERNTVDGVVHDGPQVIGILMDGNALGDGSLARGNVVRNIASPAGDSIGIRVSGVLHSAVRDNVVIALPGEDDGTGILCDVAAVNASTYDNILVGAGMENCGGGYNQTYFPEP